MTAYVIDASAGVEYLLRTPAGLALAGMLDDADLFAPELFDVEVASALRRAALHRALDPVRARVAIDDLSEWPLRRVRHRQLLTIVWELRDNFTAYDAFYVAAARRLGIGLVTCDGPLTRAPNPGVAIYDVAPPESTL